MPDKPSCRHMFPPTTIFCAGIYGSASTWAYNICRQLIFTATDERQVASFYTDTPVSGPNPNQWDGPPISGDNWQAAVIKMHEGSQEACDVIDSGAATTIITIRDPRDAIVSVMQRFKWDFDNAFAHVCNSLSFVDQILQKQSTMVLRYEDFFMLDPQSIIQIARHLQIDINDREAMQIFSSLNPESINTITRCYSIEQASIKTDSAGRLYDKVTHWHQQHHGDGSVGKWRKYLNRRERRQIRSDCWMQITRLGYAGLGW